MDLSEQAGREFACAPMARMVAKLMDVKHFIVVEGG